MEFGVVKPVGELAVVDVLFLGWEGHPQRHDGWPIGCGLAQLHLQGQAVFAIICFGLDRIAFLDVFAWLALAIQRHDAFAHQFLTGGGSFASFLLVGLTGFVIFGGSSVVLPFRRTGHFVGDGAVFTRCRRINVADNRILEPFGIQHRAIAVLQAFAQREGELGSVFVHIIFLSTAGDGCQFGVELHQALIDQLEVADFIHKRGLLGINRIWISASVHPQHFGFLPRWRNRSWGGIGVGGRSHHDLLLHFLDDFFGHFHNGLSWGGLGASGKH